MRICRKKKGVYADRKVKNKRAERIEFVVRDFAVKDLAASKEKQRGMIRETEEKLKKKKNKEDGAKFA